MASKKAFAGRCVRIGCRNLFGPDDDINALIEQGWQISDDKVARCPEHRKEP